MSFFFKRLQKKSRFWRTVQQRAPSRLPRPSPRLSSGNASQSASSQSARKSEACSRGFSLPEHPRGAERAALGQQWQGLPPGATGCAAQKGRGGGRPSARPRPFRPTVGAEAAAASALLSRRAATRLLRRLRPAWG